MIDWHNITYLDNTGTIRTTGRYDLSAWNAANMLVNHFKIIPSMDSILSFDNELTRLGEDYQRKQKGKETT
jgi:hypothetical protein